jgi:hypothetical protein
MEHKRIGFIFSILLLILLSACQMGTATPIVLGPTGLVPTHTPQPVVLVPTGLAPACSPVVPTLSQVTNFCANQAAGLGGATFVLNPSPVDPSLDYANGADLPGNHTCTFVSENAGLKSTCSGPQDAKVQIMYCSECSAGGFASVCRNGFVWNGGGTCDPVAATTDPNYTQDIQICPTGTHYDNGQQNCVDDVTSKVVSQCPLGYPYYDLAYNTCSKYAPTHIFNCQYFTVQLGECPVIKKVPGTGNQCPAGKTYKCGGGTVPICSCQ